MSDWRELATALGKLDPPSNDLQAEFRELIAEGHRAIEPTGEDMLSLFSIENREAEATRWLEEFTVAGRAAGAEMGRLYGPVDYANPEAEAPVPDLSKATINGLPIDQWLNDPAPLLRQNQEAESGGDGVTALKPE